MYERVDTALQSTVERSKAHSRSERLQNGIVSGSQSMVNTSCRSTVFFNSGFARSMQGLLPFGQREQGSRIGHTYRSNQRGCAACWTCWESRKTHSLVVWPIVTARFRSTVLPSGTTGHTSLPESQSRTGKVAERLYGKFALPFQRLFTPSGVHIR